MEETMEADQWRALLQDWQARVAAYQAAQYRLAATLQRRYYVLALPVTVFAAITGTTAFTNLNRDFSYETRLVVGVGSLAVAVVSALHTFLNYGKRSEICRSISAQLGNARREIDVLQQFPPDVPQEKYAKLRELNETIKKISLDAPLVPGVLGEGLLLSVRYY